MASESQEGTSYPEDPNDVEIVEKVEQCTSSESLTSEAKTKAKVWQYLSWQHW